MNSNDADVVINESDVFDAEFYFLDNDAIVGHSHSRERRAKGREFCLVVRQRHKV